MTAPAQRRRRPGRAGFTLLEVLVAFAIFAMGAVVLGTAYVNILNGYAAAARTDNSEVELSFARSQLLAEPDRQKAEEGVSFDETDDRHVRWTAEIESTNLPDLFTVRLRCEVTTRGRGEPQRLTETFRVLRPTWSDPVEQQKLRGEVRDRILELQKQTP